MLVSDVYCSLIIMVIIMFDLCLVLIYVDTYSYVLTELCLNLCSVDSFYVLFVLCLFVCFKQTLEREHGRRYVSQA